LAQESLNPTATGRQSVGSNYIAVNKQPPMFTT